MTTASFPSYEEAETAFQAVEDFDNLLTKNSVKMKVRIARLYKKA